MTRPITEERDEAMLAALRIIAIDEGEPGADEEVEFIDSVAVSRALLSTSASERGMREACQAMLDDHMTSEAHHPGYVLVPTAAFEKARAAILSESRSVSQERQRTQDLTDALRSLNDAMRFILAFYDPGQTHLDTNAWKLAEAEARAAHADATIILAALTSKGEGE